MKLNIFTLIVILSYLFPFSSVALTYYVSPSGKNNNAGTSASKPWQTITKVNSKNFNGDTILFLGGSTFSGSMNFTSSDVGTPLKPIVIGSSGTGRAIINSGNLDGIYVYNAAGFKIKNLVLYGSGVTTNSGAGIYFFTDKNPLLPFLKIDSVEAYGYNHAGIMIGSSVGTGGFSDISITNSVVHDNGQSGISTFGDTGLVHKNVYIGYTKAYNNTGIASQTSGNSGSGILLGNVDGGVVEYCTVYNNGWLHRSPDGGPNGVWAYLCNNILFQYNEAHSNKTGTGKDGGGFDFDGGCTNSTMQYNYSHDNYGSGYLVAQYAGVPLMKNIIIRYNISENDCRKNNYGSIHLWSSGSTLGISSVEIYNNTVYLKPSSNGTPAAFLIRSGTFSGVNVRNNIFQITGGVQLISAVSSSSVTGFNFQGNNYWTTGSPMNILWGGVNYTSLSSWRSAKGQEKINGAPSGFQLDPQFADTTTGTTFSDATKLPNLTRYKLKSSSGLIIQGLNLSAMFGISTGATDFWRNSLTNKTMFNIGAHQVSKIATISASADAYVRNGTYAAINYGNDTGLVVKTNSTVGYTRRTYLKFPVSGVSDVVSAKLRVYGRNTEGTSTVSIAAFKCDNDTWTETGITWNTAPVSGSFLFSSGVNTQARYYEYDVTSFVKTQFTGDKVVTFLIRDTTNVNKSIVFNSRQNTSNKPQLIIATTSLSSPRPALVMDSPAESAETNVLESALHAKAYPNPVKHNFIIELRNKFAGNVYIQLLDEIGRVYNLGKRSLPQGKSTINLNVSNLYLKTGVYILKVYSDKTQAAVTKLVIQ
jgi:hypothetical protein